ncbi:helix-turn-helix domain-containing protein [Streptomyces sp. NPDC092952]|uniref:helix-turn-helix domain-containing protein n=1 Tax=Streptomyces sp. NPDC092952 TaxID=3366018 RepID=UPI0038236932
MAAPVTPDDRKHVRRLHAEGKSRNQIARETGRSAATVSKIAAALGLAFSGGARVAAATEAVRADAAARREQLADDALDGALAQVERVGAADSARALTEVHAKVAELSRTSGTGSTGGSMLDRLADALLGSTGDETNGG